MLHTSHALPQRFSQIRPILLTPPHTPHTTSSSFTPSPNSHPFCTWTHLTCHPHRTHTPPAYPHLHTASTPTHPPPSQVHSPSSPLTLPPYSEPFSFAPFLHPTQSRPPTDHCKTFIPRTRLRTRPHTRQTAMRNDVRTLPNQTDWRQDNVRHEHTHRKTATSLANARDTLRVEGVGEGCGSDGSKRAKQAFSNNSSICRLRNTRRHTQSLCFDTTAHTNATCRGRYRSGKRWHLTATAHTPYQRGEPTHSHPPPYSQPNSTLIPAPPILSTLSTQYSHPSSILSTATLHYPQTLVLTPPPLLY